MRRSAVILILAMLLGILGGCRPVETAQVATTTAPVYQFTAALCVGTDITVTQLVTERVSCLHDYSLSVNQVKAAEAAEVIIISGGGLEDFMADVLDDAKVIDSSAGIEAIHCEHHSDHHHEQDSHFWLSPVHANQMAVNICQGLAKQYPQHKAVFEKNLAALKLRFDELDQYGHEQLQELTCRKLITFHDGFAYFAQAYDLHILKAIEEESGSEASARELVELIGMVREHRLPAIFTERNGGVSAAGIITRETGIKSYALDMCMGKSDYFKAMRHNIDTIKEALG